VKSLPPHDTDAEEAVNGSLLIDGKSIYLVSTIIKPSDFFSEANSLIFQAALSLYQRDEMIDQITVSQELSRLGQLDKVGGATYLNYLVSVVPTSLDIEHYAQIVYRLSIMRQLVLTGEKISSIGYEADPDVGSTLSKAEDLLFRLRAERKSLDFVPIRSILDKYFEETLPQQVGEGHSLPQINTGFHGLDDLLGGMQRSDLIVLAGRPSMGKTSLAMNIARNAAVDQKACVAVFSLEMSSESLVRRLLASEAEINSKHMRVGFNSDYEERAIMEAQGKLSSASIFIDDSPMIRIAEMRSKARRLHYEHPLDLIVLDYLQLLQSEGRNENRVQELSNITRSLKGIARELNVPLIAVSQLSRAVESRAIHTPQLSDLRESGSIEQDADIVIFIYRAEAYYKTEEDWAREHAGQEYPRELADIIVAKHRNGPTDTVVVRFKKAFTKFENLSSPKP